MFRLGHFSYTLELFGCLGFCINYYDHIFLFYFIYLTPKCSHHCYKYQHLQAFALNQQHKLPRKCQKLVIEKKIQIMQEDKKVKVKKGWFAIEVGLDEDRGFQRFVIPISYLYHPLFKRLLEKAHEAYGYHTTGPLRLPCSTHDFLNLKWRIEKESNHHHHLPLTLSFHSC